MTSNAALLSVTQSLLTRIFSANNVDGFEHMSLQNEQALARMNMFGILHTNDPHLANPARLEKNFALCARIVEAVFEDVETPEGL